ncbi:MAG TPA: tetratricopeptide repeat protein [Candidatus Obscuribacterales bacterium]
MVDELNPKDEDTSRTLGWKMLLKTAVLHKRKPDAERLYLRTLELVKRRLGDRHKATACVLMEVAEFYCLQGNHAQACSYFMEAKSIISPQIETDDEWKTLLAELEGP